MLFLAILVCGSVFYLATNNMKDSSNAFALVTHKFAELEQNKTLEKATFAGGCFWCMEGPFEQEPGVIAVLTGYSGGHTPNPTYDQVISGITGHREAVQIYFDPAKVTYERLLDIYWAQIDPTDSGGQFSDRGLQYTTAIFYRNEKQREVAQKSLDALEQKKIYTNPIVTKILPAENFYPAEDYHQDFYLNSAERYNSYERLSGRKAHKEKLKELLGIN